MRVPGQTPFNHQALLYGDDDAYCAGTLPLVRSGMENEEPVLVAAGRDKIELLKGELGADASAVQFADMRSIGVNPAAIISAWREFVDQGSAPGRRLWGIGEPVWPERSAEELVECHRHECLLNAAFADTAGFTLLCPYDVSALPAEVIERVDESHPAVLADGAERASLRYRGLDGLEELLEGELPDPAGTYEEIPFDVWSLDGLRGLVLERAHSAGFGDKESEEAVLAANELASNSVRHAGGQGRLRIWRQDGSVVVEVRDDGVISDPLVGRQLPADGGRGGFGLWMVNQLSELVQVRSGAGGTIVRARLRKA